MPPAVANRVTAAIVGELQGLVESGRPPVVLASPQVRAAVHRLLEPHLPQAAVLGYNEVSRGVEVESLGLVTMEEAQPTGKGKRAEAKGQPRAASPKLDEEAVSTGAGFGEGRWR